MNVRIVYPILMSSLVLSCDAGAAYGSFEGKGPNRKPSSEYRRQFAASVLECAAACGNVKECTSFAYDGKKTCVLSETADDSEEAEGFMHFLKKDLRSMRPNQQTAATKSEPGDKETITSTTSRSTVKEQATTTAPTQKKTEPPPATKDDSSSETSGPSGKPPNPKYKIITEKKNYEDAEKACHDDGRKLVTIKDENTSKKVIKWMEENKKAWKVCDDTWIGLKAIDTNSKTFQWSDGENLKGEDNETEEESSKKEDGSKGEKKEKSERSSKPTWFKEEFKGSKGVKRDKREGKENENKKQKNDKGSKTSKKDSKEKPKNGSQDEKDTPTKWSSWTNWDKGEPNEYVNENEGCVRLTTDSFKWRDKKCNTDYCFICEV